MRRNGLVAFASFVCFSAGALASTCANAQATSTSSGQAYPAKPIRLIVPATPGGGSDVPARIMTQALTDDLGWRFVVENRGGASGRIGTELAAKAPADGYTLLLGGATPNAVIQSVVPNLPYDTLRDFAPISLVSTSDFTLVAHPSLPVKTVQDLITLARSRPGQINFGSVGNLSGAHVTGELLKQLAGGVHRIHPVRDRQVGKGGQGVRHACRLMTIVNDDA